MAMLPDLECDRAETVYEEARRRLEEEIGDLVHLVTDLSGVLTPVLASPTPTAEADKTLCGKMSTDSAQIEWMRSLQARVFAENNRLRELHNRIQLS